MAVVALLLILIAAVCNAQIVYKCQAPVEIPYNITPFFDEGQNLSFPDCGTWPDEADGADAPWKVKIFKNPQGIRVCDAVLVSKYNILSVWCNTVAAEFMNDPERTRAHFGSCSNENKKDSCHILKIKDVKLIPGNPQLTLWRLKQPAKFSPICIFNQHSQNKRNFEIFNRNWTERKQVDIVGASAIATKDSPHLCVHSVKNLNNYNNTYIISTYLVKRHKERFFLRGFYFREEKKVKFTIFADVLPYMRNVIAKSYDMYIKPATPDPRPDTTLIDGSGLNSVGCGQSPSKNKGNKVRRETREPLDHILRGHNAEPNTHPWHVSLSDVGEREFINFCGGTIISPTAVITAAHCIYNSLLMAAEENFKIVAGMHTAKNENETQRQSHYVKEIIVHPEYRKRRKDHDLALLLLKKPGFVFNSDAVKPICMWDDDYDFTSLTTKNGTVVGWGRMGETRSQANVLQQASIPLQSYEECYLQEKQFFGKYLKPGYNFCAGDPILGKSTCQGDSGGGLTIKRNGKWYLRGVVSFGIVKKINETFSTCDEKFSSLFVDVTGYMDWIVQTLMKHH